MIIMMTMPANRCGRLLPPIAPILIPLPLPFMSTFLWCTWCRWRVCLFRNSRLIMWFGTEIDQVFLSLFFIERPVKPDSPYGSRLGIGLIFYFGYYCCGQWRALERNSLLTTLGSGCSKTLQLQLIGKGIRNCCGWASFKEWAQSSLSISTSQTTILCCIPEEEDWPKKQGTILDMRAPLESCKGMIANVWCHCYVGIFWNFNPR